MRHLTFNRRCAETDGNVAAIFAVIFFPMMLVVAATVDTARQVTINRHVQVAVDSATLAGALLLQDETLTDDDAEMTMVAVFQSNSQISRSDLSCSEPTVPIKRDDHGVDFSVDCLLPKTFGAISSNWKSIWPEGSIPSDNANRRSHKAIVFLGHSGLARLLRSRYRFIDLRGGCCASVSDDREQ